MATNQLSSCFTIDKFMTVTLRVDTNKGRVIYSGTVHGVDNSIVCLAGTNERDASNRRFIIANRG